MAGSVAYADQLIAAGRRDEAVDLLNALADSGDVDALFRLAVAHLVGDLVPRDLPQARRRLRDAARIGHVDAALMEIALVANGSGAEPDWPAALTLLRTAATADPVAASHLAMLDRMTLDDQGAPLDTPPSRRLSTRPDVRLFPALFTPDECRHVAESAADLLEPAIVVDPQGRAITNPVRTSAAAVIGPTRETLVIQALNRRIAAATGTDWRQGEPLALLCYDVGQQYRPHLDILPGTANQRGWTMLVYLNENYRGGETTFPASGLTIKGQIGDGLLFANLDPDGRPDRAPLHAGLPIKAGRKWLCTRWIRQRPVDIWKPPG